MCVSLSLLISTYNAIVDHKHVFRVQTVGGNDSGDGFFRSKRLVRGKGRRVVFGEHKQSGSNGDVLVMDQFAHALFDIQRAI